MNTSGSPDTSAQKNESNQLVLSQEINIWDVFSTLKIESVPKTQAATKLLFWRYFPFFQSTGAQARHHVVAQASLNFENEKPHLK